LKLRPGGEGLQAGFSHAVTAADGRFVSGKKVEEIMSEKKTQEGPITIEATVRTGAGKSYTRKLRASGKLPGNLVVKGKSTMIEFDPKDLSLAVKAGKKFNLVLSGKTIPVEIDGIAVESLKRKPLHVDLKPQ
jgi:ribosomal protein L25 (general stress protein Ctc)